MVMVRQQYITCLANILITNLLFLVFLPVAICAHLWHPGASLSCVFHLECFGSPDAVTIQKESLFLHSHVLRLAWLGTGQYFMFTTSCWFFMFF